MTLNYNFRASSGRDTHGTPERREAPIRECDLCTEPAHAKGLCKLHYDREWRRKEREELDAVRERRIARYEARQGQLAPIRLVPVPDDPEMAEARRRYPLVSDTVALEQHRRNPRGGTS